jgi:hypothetical protein
MSRSAGDDWVLDEAEALLDMDGRRERLERAAADLQSGKVQPAGHAAARDRIENASETAAPPVTPGPSSQYLN